MDHGTSGYFRERERFARRTSLMSFVVSLSVLLLLSATRIPFLHRALIDTARFGFEGRDQYVRRITIQEYEGHSTLLLSDLGRIQPRAARRGGDPSPRRRGDGRPVVKMPVRGPGEGVQDIPARLVSRYANVPVVRSEDLVIDRLVRPEYPRLLLDKNIEGKVTLQALVDTVGRVVDVQVLTSTGENLFERAAEEAVRQCLFRPYRPGGEAIEVYAVFRFSFRIYY